MLLLLLPPFSLVCVVPKLVAPKKKKKTTAKLLIFKCTQWLNLSWLPPISPKLRLLWPTNPEWCWNSKPLCNKSKSCSAICFYYYYYSYYYCFFGGGGVVLYSSEVEWKEMDHDHECWSAILPAQEERERESRQTRGQKKAQR